MKDIHGQAILDYYHSHHTDAILHLHNSYGEPEEMPVEVFFRDEMELTTLEHLALIECRGKVLDLGAGAGAHSLILQSRDFDVTSLDYSPGCVEVMQQSGLEQVLLCDYRTHTGKYDTVLLLMNGLGLAGTVAGVAPLLRRCCDLLLPGGQILLDSSDISYLYEDGLARPAGYYGEVRYQYEYRGAKGDWFNWIYLDQKSLARIVRQTGLQMEVLHTDESDQYLACITVPASS